MKKHLKYFISILILFVLIFILSENINIKNDKSVSNDSTFNNKNTTENPTETTTENSTETTTEKPTETTTENSTAVNTEEFPPIETSGSESNIINSNDSKGISIAFTGDILLSDKLYERYSSGGINGFLSPIVADTLKNADITFADEEFPFSTRGSAQYKEYTYRVNPDYAQIFTEMGIDIVSLANNHVKDYGSDALMDTFTTLDNNKIDYIGAGPTLDRAKQLITYEVNGKKIGFLSASRVIPDGSWYALNETENHASNCGVFGTYDDTDLCNEIKAAKQTCDFIVVYVHWGIEKQSEAVEYQRIMAKDYIDAGAGLVVGTHPHILQGVEYYKDVPIVYSL